MGSISFGGLATGLDTDSLVKQIMQVERRPLTRLQSDKSWQNTRLSALGTFNGKLESFLGKIEDLDSATDLQARKAELSTRDYFSATADSSALPGSYQVEVLDLAQVEKEVSLGYADRSSHTLGTGTLSISIGTADPVDVTIDDSNNSLEGMMQAINGADAGVTAAIINDGTASPHRLVLTADDVAKAVAVDPSGLIGGSDPNPSFTETQTGQQAHIKVDGIDIYSDDNTVQGAIPGVTLDLARAETGARTTLTVKTDEEAIKSRVQDFVDGYNEVVSFVTSQSVIGESPGGILKGDAGINSIKRRLQDMLVSFNGNSGSLQTMSQLGIETQKDGTVVVDDETLSNVIRENLGDLSKLLAGEEGTEGAATHFKNYLGDITDSVDGFYAGRKKTIDNSLKRLDKTIEQTTARLDHREETLRSQFTALETMVSGLNTQSEYVAQQMSMLNNMWSQGS